MAFLKLRCERAYATGGLRTHLSPRELAAKLSRNGVNAYIWDGELRIDDFDNFWVFEGWQSNGIGWEGWLRFTTEGDIGGLSRKLARIGVRHKLDWSRPRDLETDDWRCVTQYQYRWDIAGGRRPIDIEPSIVTLDEEV